MRRGLTVRSAALDAGIGIAALALSLGVGRHAAASQPGTRPLDVAGYILTVLACVAVIGRGVIPLPVLGVVMAALVVFAVRNYPGGPLLIPVMVALYTAGTALERPAALCVGTAATVVVVARAQARTGAWQPGGGSGSVRASAPGCR
jgi:hypothetical protein